MRLLRGEENMHIQQFKQHIEEQLCYTGIPNECVRLSNQGSDRYRNLF